MPYQSQGGANALVFQYSSAQADPHPVVQFSPSLQSETRTPSLQNVTASAGLSSVTQGSAITFTKPAAGWPNGPAGMPVQVDATPLATGAYPFDLTVTMNYNGPYNSAVAADYTTRLTVVNAASSPYGAGWSVGGLQHVFASGTGPAVVTAGSQGTEAFGYRPAGAVTDLATVVAGPSFGGAATQLLANDGGGTGGFTVPSSAAGVSSQPTATAAADFNGDGRADLVEVSGATVTVLTANASGGFTAGGTYNLGTGVNAIAVVTGRFGTATYGAGYKDFAVLQDNGSIAVFSNNGGGSFTASGGGGGAGTITTPGSMAAADFNGDGITDLAVASTTDDDLHVLIGNGSAGFSSNTAVPIPDPQNPVTHVPTRLVAAGHFTGGSPTDLAVMAGGEALFILTGNGSGGFAVAGHDGGYNGSLIVAMAAGDFYGDGRDALAVLNSGGSVVTRTCSPSGTLGHEVFYPLTVSSTMTMLSADLNGDGKADLAVANGSASIQLLMSNPDANQMEPWRTVTDDYGPGYPGVLAAAPFTGRSLATRYAAPMGHTSTLTHNGDGTWTRAYPDGSSIRFDSAGRETSQADRNGNTTSYSYVTTGAAAGALQTVTDPVGLVTTLAYDVSGRLNTATDPAGRVTSFSVNAAGNLTQITDPDGAVTGYGYSTPANHRITTEVNPDGRTATAHYDGFGRLTSEDLFGGAATTYVSGAQEQGLNAAGSTLPLPTAAVGSLGSVTDPNGHTTSLVFDDMGHVAASTDAAGKTTTTTRDMMTGWATAVTDPLNRTTHYEYDMEGNVTKVTRPDSSYETVVYDPTFNVPTRVTDSRNLTTSFALDAHGNVTRRTDPDLGYEDYTYNSAGQVLTDTDRNNHTTGYAYDGLGRLTTITYPGTGAPTARLGYDAAGDVTGVTDELGHVTTFTYDNAGRVVSRRNPAEAAAGKATTYAYDPAGNRTGVTDALNHTTTYAYDARNRLTGVTDPFNQGTGRQTAYGYDALGNLTGVTDPLGHQTTFGYDADNRRTSTTDPLGHTTAYGYDAAGQLTGVTDANSHTAAYGYDALGRLQTVTRPGLTASTAYGYDADGNLTSVTDPLGDVRRYGYDDLNRRTSESRYTDPYGYNALTTTYGYDPAGNRTSVTDGLGHATTYAYDERDRLVSETRPSGGGTTTSAYDAHSRRTSLTDPVNNVTSWGYDAADRLTTETDPRGKVTTYAYDLANNLTQKTDRDNRVTQYGYDADDRRTTETWVGASPAEAVVTGYDAAGRVTGVSDAFSRYAYTYDNADRLTGVDDLETPTLPRVVLTYGYDNAGNRTSLGDGLGGVTSYTYDVRDELTSLTQSGTGVAPKRADFAYDAAGRRTTLTRYGDLAGSTTVLVTAYAYDNADRLTGLTHQTAAGAVLASYGYTLDAADRLTSEARSWNTGASSDTVTYGYTNDDQLTSVAHANAAFAAESFGYDANGNRNTTGSTTAAGNRLTGDGTYTYGYDDEGNLTSKTAVATGNQTLYTWDYRNRLVGVDSKVGGVTTAVARYTYDAVGRRIGVVEGSSSRWTVYDGVAPVLDFNGTGAQTARYLQGPAVDEVLARETSGVAVAWYLADRLGTVRDLVDNTGAVIDHVDYGVFGTVTGETSPSAGDRFKFAGLEYDAATGLNLAVHRVLLSPAGIWASTDPLGFAAGDANLYRYVGNDAQDWSDAGGLFRSRPLTPPEFSYVNQLNTTALS